MIVLDHVTKVYHPNHVALQDVSLAIGAGEFVSIIGQSGAGKTTLAKLLIADERPTQGKVSVGGWDVGGASSMGTQLTALKAIYDRSDCLGGLYWSVTDQDTSTSNQYGTYATTGSGATIGVGSARSAIITAFQALSGVPVPLRFSRKRRRV